MAHRFESVAISACRRLGQSPSIRSGVTRTYTSAPLQTSCSRIRPATYALPSHTDLIGSQHRQFHITTIAQDDASAPAAAKTDEPIAPFKSAKVEELFNKVIFLDMVEVHLLAELINEKMGIKISDAERNFMAGGGGGGGGKAAGGEEAAEPAEEKTAFDLKLTGFDPKSKIKVIKEVRAMTSLGLKEAKELVDKAPSTVKKDIKKEEAEELKAKLEALGAQVEIV